METEKSIDSVRKSIEKKIRGPYMANNKSVMNSVTDQDHHPYTRYFRGVYYFPDPIVFEREAGWRPIHNNCYDMQVPPREETHPHHCYEAPCSTTFPCYPQYLTKYADKNALDVMINNACVVQYR
jgi:hypothetical protein